MIKNLILIIILFGGLNSQNCQENCSSCTSQFSCQECNPGYSFINETSCEKCKTENCKICDKSLTNCRKCNSGFFLKNNTIECGKCEVNCVECSENGKCISCSTLYYLNSSGICKFQWWIPIIFIPFLGIWIVDFLIYRPWDDVRFKGESVSVERIGDQG